MKLRKATTIAGVTVDDARLEPMKDERPECKCGGRHWECDGAAAPGQITCLACRRQIPCPHTLTFQFPWPCGSTCEFCALCGMSRSRTEFTESPWGFHKDLEGDRMELEAML